MGNRNTKFFQIVVKHRRARNRILQVKDEDGRLTDKPEEIENILANDFKSSYELHNHTSVDSIIQELQNLPIPKLSPQQIGTLNRPLSDKGIEDIVFMLGPLKALGLASIPAFFFQEY